MEQTSSGAHIMSNDHQDIALAQIVDSWISVQSEGHKIVQELRNSALSRLVWFVAIDGFLFINVRVFSEAVLGYPVKGRLAILLSLPWAISGFFSVVCHYVKDEVAKRDGLYYSRRMIGLEMLKFELLNPKPNQPALSLDDFKGKLYGEDAPTTQAKTVLGRWSKAASIFEVLAFLFLGIGFILTVAIIVYCTA
jgi:hypothetical protein